MKTPEIGSLYTKLKTATGFVSMVLLVDGTWSDDTSDGRAAIFFRAYDAHAFLEKCKPHMGRLSYRNSYYSTKGV
jgi:hypothetical protein